MPRTMPGYLAAAHIISRLRACKTGSWPDVQDGLLARRARRAPGQNGQSVYPRGIGGWRLYARAGWWKLNGGLRGRHGFKFANGFLDASWGKNLPVLQDFAVINNFQLFGSHFLRSHQPFGIAPPWFRENCEIVSTCASLGSPIWTPPQSSSSSPLTGSP